MSTADRASAAISRLSQINTELTARRELRDRSAAAARSSAKETMLKIGPVAEKVAEHMGEMGRRQREAGGWATESTLADKEPVFGFERDEDDAPDAEYARYAAPVEDKEEDTIGVLAEADDKPVAEPPREVPIPSAVEPSAPQPPVRRRTPVDDAEDDDFSNMSSWLKE